ncbi:MAG: M48 family metalloprotease [Rhizobiaceae bacterium]
MPTLPHIAVRIARVSRRAAVAALAVGLAAVGQAQAQTNIPIVRDAEIEALVRDYARPILKAAGLSKSGIDIVLVNDDRFNAFVAGRRMFINTGALLMSETPNEIIGVLAHEAGHLAGRHQERLREQIARAQTMAVVAGLLGVGATIAGAATNSGGLAQAGTGIAAAGGEFARRGLLSYQRTEEATADRSAIKYLDATGQSAKGMLKTFERLQGSLALSGAQINPYEVSHPLPRDRIANLETLARNSPNFDRIDSAELQERHDMMRVKIAVNTQGQAAHRRLFRGRESTELAMQYGEAISTYLYGNQRSALAKADALVKVRPKNAYFHELRGDILIKANQPAEAAKAYATAAKLDPARSGILQVSYGQALLATGKPDSVRKAIDVINQGIDRDRENVSAYRFLAQAYGQVGDIADAELASAEGAFYSGAYQDAKVFAARAQMKFKTGAPGWVRAQDIINYKPPGKKK